MLKSKVFAASDAHSGSKERLSPGDEPLRLRKQNEHIRDHRITFFPQDHKYVLDSGACTEYTFPCSVSGICSKYFEEFDATAVCNQYYEKWAGDSLSPYFAIIESGRAGGLSNEEIKYKICNDWRVSGEKAAEEGTKMHKAIELALNGCAYEYSSIEICYFHNYVKEYLEPRGWQAFRTEWSIYDLSAGVAGQIDCVFYDASADAFHLVDWKRSKKVLEPDTGICFGRRGRPPCEKLIDNAWSRYALQQNLYAEILKRHYGIVVSTLSLAQVHRDLPGYRIIEIPLMAELATAVLDTCSGHQTPSGVVNCNGVVQRQRSRSRSH